MSRGLPILSFFIKEVTDCTLIVKHVLQNDAENCDQERREKLSPIRGRQPRSYNMIRTKLAKKLLTKKEQRHLTKDAGINSIAALERQIESQKKLNPDFPNSVCFECWGIACKLDLV